MCVCARARAARLLCRAHGMTLTLLLKSADPQFQGDHATLTDYLQVTSRVKSAWNILRLETNFHSTMLQMLSSSMHSNSLDLSNRGLKAFPMVRSCDHDERVPVVVLRVGGVESCGLQLRGTVL